MTAKKQRSLCSKITKISISENGENKRFHTNSIYLFNAPHTISENCWVPSHWTSKIMFFKVIYPNRWAIKALSLQKKKKNNNNNIKEMTSWTSFDYYRQMSKWMMGRWKMEGQTKHTYTSNNTLIINYLKYKHLCYTKRILYIFPHVTTAYIKP